MARLADVQLRYLKDRILRGRGHLDAAVRQAAFANAPVPDALQPMTTKIIEAAYTVTADDIDRAKEAGYSENALFDLIASASVGTGLRRLEIIDALLA